MARMIDVLHNHFYKRVKDRIAIQTTILGQATIGQVRIQLEQEVEKIVQEAIAAELDNLATIELTYESDKLTIALNALPPPVSPPPVVEPVPTPPAPPAEPPVDPVVETPPVVELPPIEVIDPAPTPVVEVPDEPAVVDSAVVDSPRVSP